jgi:hypothetical protein
MTPTNPWEAMISGFSNRVGGYWQDFNKQVKAGQVNPLVSGIANFTPGPALGQMYSGIQQGNVPGAASAAISAFPLFVATRAFKTLGPGYATPKAIDWGTTKVRAASQTALGLLAEGLEEPLDISFGSKEGN